MYHKNTGVFVSNVYPDMSIAFCHHRAVRSGHNGGVCHPLPDPSVEEASPMVVDLSSSPQDQGVPSVWAQRLVEHMKNQMSEIWIQILNV